MNKKDCTTNGVTNWHQWHREGHQGFWNAIRFFAEMKIGDYTPGWFNEEYEAVKDQGGYWFLSKLIILAFSSAISGVLFGIYMALHFVWGWIFIGVLAGIVGIFFLFPMIWRLIFNACDKAKEVKETISKLETVVSAQVQDGRSRAGGEIQMTPEELAIHREKV